MRTLVHELRNQLAIATANIEAFIDGKLAPSETRLQSVLQALTTLDKLLDEVPALVTGPSGLYANQHLAELNMCGLIRRLFEGMVAAAAEKKIQLALTQCEAISDDCKHFIADPTRVAQVINNVMLNAVAYTPEGGRIAVDCHRGPGNIIFTIEDTGLGLSDEDLEHLFERGYRGSASAGIAGSGLGLSFVKQYLDSQGGSIQAKRMMNGTAFMLQLASADHACVGCDHCDKTAGLPQMLS